MTLLRGLDDLEGRRGGALSIGNFDGVHLGHQLLAKRLAARAQAIGGPAVVLTFDPTPAAVLRPDQVPPRLTTLETRAEWLHRLGVDAVVAYPTDVALLQLSPQAFFQQIVLERFAARAIVEGSNFCFGRARTGTIATLQSLCGAVEIPCDVVPIEALGGTLVSSSEIRRLIGEGAIAKACELLGHGFRMTGDVVAGAQRGRTLGFPTANLSNVETLLPPDGVYAAVCDGLDDPYAAAVNIGPNPTFGEGARKIEAHLIGFEGDLYGQALTLDLIAKVRDVARFSSAESLRSQLALDVAAASRIAQEFLADPRFAWSRG